MPFAYPAFNVFWRTFVLLALLLAAGIFAWVQTLRALELEPRAVQAAQQIASLVNLSREALRYTDRIIRVALVKAMSASEAIRLMPREPGDRWEPFEEDHFTQGVGSELRARLGADTIAARRRSAEGNEGGTKTKPRPHGPGLCRCWPTCIETAVLLCTS